jgi:ferredoxin--NADP+ reductase
MTTTLPDVPSNLYKPTEPLKAVVLENRRLTAPDSPNDVCHIVLNLKGSRYQYVEGQSVGILPPGTDANGKPHKLRLYSIASPGIGDDRNGETLSICVKRALTTDPETGVVYKGVCSNYLCDLPVGTEVLATGPVGKGFLMPEIADPNVVMIATGTGIAPFRAFLDKLYKQAPVSTGNHWLFFGVQTQKDYLYADELDALAAEHKGFNLVTAFSREQQAPGGGRMYVQHRLEEHAKAIIALLQDPKTYLFICGLKGMEDGILKGLSTAAQTVGVNWDDLYAQLRTEKRWRVEVY